VKPKASQWGCQNSPCNRGPGPATCKSPSLHGSVTAGNASVKRSDGPVTATWRPLPGTPSPGLPRRSAADVPWSGRPPVGPGRQERAASAKNHRAPPGPTGTGQRDDAVRSGYQQARETAASLAALEGGPAPPAYGIDHRGQTRITTHPHCPEDTCPEDAGPGAGPGAGSALLQGPGADGHGSRNGWRAMSAGGGTEPPSRLGLEALGFPKARLSHPLSIISRRPHPCRHVRT